MTKKYKLILAALRKGNAVMVNVQDEQGDDDRHRVLQPNDCEFIFDKNDYFWGRSCFLYFPLVAERTPETIVQAMYEYDKKNNLTLKEIEVIK